MKKNINEEWIKDTALLFYQIFSPYYTDEKFNKKLVTGGGGNSTLCSTWTQLSDKFLSYRISKRAYQLLLNLISDEDRSAIVKINNDVTISKKIIYDKYHKLFFNNAKGVVNRKKNGKYFHFDHNPSNKKVLTLLKSKIKGQKGTKKFLNELTEYVKKVQTIDLITVEEDEVRTNADSKLKDNKINALERDKLIKAEFYNLHII